MIHSTFSEIQRVASLDPFFGKAFEAISGLGKMK